MLVSMETYSRLSRSSSRPLEGLFTCQSADWRALPNTAVRVQLLWCSHRSAEQLMLLYIPSRTCRGEKWSLLVFDLLLTTLIVSHYLWLAQFHKWLSEKIDHELVTRVWFSKALNFLRKKKKKQKHFHIIWDFICYSVLHFATVTWLNISQVSLSFCKH